MKITLLEGLPKEIAVAGALGCASQKSSAEILAELQGMEPDKRDKKCEVVLKNSFGIGHGSVGDQATFQFSISGITRLSTLFLCQSPYASFLQQSLRRVQAGDYKLPDILASKKYAKDVVDRAFDLYTRMVEAGIPAEDARYILPLCTTTNIQMTVGAREFCHFSTMARSENAPIRELYEIIDCADREIDNYKKDGLLVNYGPNYEPLSFYPACDLFAEEGPVDNRWSKEDCYEIKNTNNIYMGIEEFKKAIVDRNPTYLSLLKHIHFTFIFGMSIACFHQAVRQRTWDHCVETLANAAKQDNRVVIPPSIASSEFVNEFVDLHCEMVVSYREMINHGITKSDAFNLIPHSLKIYDLIHINGWNAIHSLGKRCCSCAQWEIRGIANKAKQIIEDQYPELGRYVGPQCLTYGVCPENKSCGMVRSLRRNENDRRG